ncbi:MAG: hypothetical protein RJB65_986 [Actinomycetota bacterium]
MNCPTCPSSTLVMADRAGIEIDYCPTCRGVWLDRGELDKIIERSAAPTAVSRSDRHDDRDDHRSYEKPYKKKKSSILGEIFDF